MNYNIGTTPLVVETPMTKVLSTLHSGQGLVVDGSDIYYGWSNGTNVNGSVSRYINGIKQTNFGVNGDAPAPVHAAEGTLRADYNSLVFSGLSTSSGLDPTVREWRNQIWEIDRFTGATLRKWNIANSSMPTGTWIGNKIAYGRAPGRFFLLVTPTSGTSAAYNMWRIAEVYLNDDGTYQIINWWKYGINIGVVQGMEYQGGYIWMDASGSLYRFTLPPGGGLDPNTAALLTWPAIVTSLPSLELEGLSYERNTGVWYYGDAKDVQRMGPFNSSVKFGDLSLTLDKAIVPA